MKTPAKLIIAGMALFVANLAFATATMHDVETAVNINKDYRQAEVLIRELVAQSPNDARDHYVYSQILHHNGKHDEAVHELAEAKRLDPAISFVKDPAHVASYEAQLQAEAGVPRPGSDHKLRLIIWLLIGAGVLGVAGYFYFRREQDKERVEDEGRTKVARQEQLKQASALLETVKPFKLDIRMANPANPTLLAEVEGVERDLVNLVERLGQSPVAQAEIDQLAESLAHLHRVFEGKADPAPVAPVAPVAQPGYENSQYTDPNGFHPVAAPMYPQPMYQQPVPQTVYVENNNGGMGVGGGLLTGMVIGSMMGGGHEREVIHEVREVPSRRYENDYDAVPAGSNQSDIDFGNESDSSSVDFGGSDDN